MVDLFLPSSQKFSVIVISNLPSNSSEKFLQAFEKLLEAKQILHLCLVVIDMNLDLLKQNAFSKFFLNLSLSIGFKQMVSQSTKRTVLNKSCIDSVLTNDHNIVTRVLKTDISDLFGVLPETIFFVETETAKRRH